MIPLSVQNHQKPFHKEVIYHNDHILVLHCDFKYQVSLGYIRYFQHMVDIGEKQRITNVKRHIIQKLHYDRGINCRIEEIDESVHRKSTPQKITTIWVMTDGN